MANLTHFFKRSEFACKCGCGKNTIDYELLLVLEELRIHFNKPVQINSGNRCAKHNKKIGGSPNSQHLKSKAVDIILKDIYPDDVYEYLIDLYPNHYGIGKYAWGVHIDVRENKARW